jgi:hypothetical protein
MSQAEDSRCSGIREAHMPTSLLIEPQKPMSRWEFSPSRHSLSDPFDQGEFASREFCVIVLEAWEQVTVHVESHLDRAMAEQRFGEKPLSIAHDAKKCRRACIPYFGRITGFPFSSFASGSGSAIPAQAGARKSPDSRCWHDSRRCHRHWGRRAIGTPRRPPLPWLAGIPTATPSAR